MKRYLGKLSNFCSTKLQTLSKPWQTCSPGIFGHLKILNIFRGTKSYSIPSKRGNILQNTCYLCKIMHKMVRTHQSEKHLRRFVHFTSDLETPPVQTISEVMHMFLRASLILFEYFLSY